jgi:hypothetical protein
MIHWEDEERRLYPWALAAGDATGWFEELYAAGRVTMPWSRTEPHVLLAEWTPYASAGRCGATSDRRRLWARRRR